MKNNIFKKNCIVYKDFYDVTDNEDFIGLIISFIIFSIIPIILPLLSLDKINDFISSLITVAALFISFTLTYIALLYSGDNKSLDILKTKKSKNKKINGKNVSLFQIVHSQTVFLLNVEVIFLILLLIIKLLVYYDVLLKYNLLIGFPTGFLAIIIFLLVLNVRNMYLLFFNRE